MENEKLLLLHLSTVRVRLLRARRKPGLLCVTVPLHRAQIGSSSMRVAAARPTIPTRRLSKTPSDLSSSTPSCHAPLGSWSFAASRKPVSEARHGPPLSQSAPTKSPGKNLPKIPSTAYISLQRNSAVEPGLAGEDEATLKAAQRPATFERRKPRTVDPKTSEGPSNFGRAERWSAGLSQPVQPLSQDARQKLSGQTSPFGGGFRVGADLLGTRCFPAHCPCQNGITG